MGAPDISLDVEETRRFLDRVPLAGDLEGHPRGEVAAGVRAGWEWLVRHIKFDYLVSGRFGRRRTASAHEQAQPEKGDCNARLLGPADQDSSSL